MSSRSNFIDEEHELSKKLMDFYNRNPYGDRRYKGVTKVLGMTKPEEDVKFLEEWKARVGEEEADRIVKESMSIGNSLDMIIEKYMAPGFNYSDYKSESGIRLFNQMKPVLSKITPIGTQIHMYSDKYEIQGYLDCVGIYNNALTMIDFKNSRSKKPRERVHDYFLQAAMYCIMIHEMTGIVIKDICIILGVRNSTIAQVERAKLVDYIKPAKDRLNMYKELREKQ